MEMDSNVQTINVQISDILVNIAPGTVRILMAVMNTVDSDQVTMNKQLRLFSVCSLDASERRCG